MDSDRNIHVSCGGGFAGLLTVLFVLFKVFGLVSWSWWWVFSPLWITGGIVLVLVAAIIGLTAWLTK